MSDVSKNNREIAAEIVIAWMSAKAQVISAKSSSDDIKIPTAAEAAAYFKTVYEAVLSPKG